MGEAGRAAVEAPGVRGRGPRGEPGLQDVQGFLLLRLSAQAWGRPSVAGLTTCRSFEGDPVPPAGEEDPAPRGTGSSARAWLWSSASLLTPSSPSAPRQGAAPGSRKASEASWEPHLSGPTNRGTGTCGPESGRGRGCVFPLLSPRGSHWRKLPGKPTFVPEDLQKGPPGAGERVPPAVPSLCGRTSSPRPAPSRVCAGGPSAPHPGSPQRVCPCPRTPAPRLHGFSGQGTPSCGGHSSPTGKQSERSPRGCFGLRGKPPPQRAE